MGAIITMAIVPKRLAIVKYISPSGAPEPAIVNVLIHNFRLWRSVTQLRSCVSWCHPEVVLCFQLSRKYFELLHHVEPTFHPTSNPFDSPSVSGVESARFAAEQFAPGQGAIGGCLPVTTGRLEGGRSPDALGIGPIFRTPSSHFHIFHQEILSKK